MYSTQYYTFIKLVESVYLNNLNLEMILASLMVVWWRQ